MASQPRRQPGPLVGRGAPRDERRGRPDQPAAGFTAAGEGSSARVAQHLVVPSGRIIAVGSGSHRQVARRTHRQGASLTTKPAARPGPVLVKTLPPKVIDSPKSPASRTFPAASMDTAVP